MVGWRGTSWGYHGDDGTVFHDSTYGMPDLQYPTFGKGDTVGCGLDKKNRIFFTMNGEKLGSWGIYSLFLSHMLTWNTGTPFESVVGQLFPIVRMSHGFNISTSFGNPFQYHLTGEDISTPADLEEILQEKMARFQQLKEDRKTEDDEDNSSEDMHSTQSDEGPVVSKRVFR